MNIIIAMAGAGTRFQKSGIKTPKPLITVLGKTLIEYSIESFDVPGRFIFITRDFGEEDNQALSELLKKLRPESVEIKLKTPTSGATESVLHAREFINNDEPLVIYNCDQWINWDVNDFLNFIKSKKPNSALVLYNSQDPKNSFAEIKMGKIVKVVEKQAISNHALVGLHYWSKGKHFVKSAELLMENFRSNGRPECYISETFNYLVPGTAGILPYHIGEHVYVPLGTPEDVAAFIGKSREYYTEKPRTLFIDIDGTILKHNHVISETYANDPVILPGVLKKFNEWDSRGHKIILVTARKESTRAITEKHLQSLGLAYDQLIMGVTSGPRIVINDVLKFNDPERALGINVITDQGFNDINWDNYDL